MRPSPKQLLHGLLYAAPILLLALASCGGGGGGSTTPGVTPSVPYTLGGVASGVLGTGLTLRNNGGDDLPVASSVATTNFTFNTKVISGTPYSVTVYANPTSPIQRCTVTNASGTMPAYNLTNVLVSCVDAATLPTSDPYVYAVNSGSTGTNGVSAYTSTKGFLGTPTPNNAESGPSSIAVDPGSKFAFVTNQNSNTISAYSITSGVLALISPAIVTGSSPRSIAVDPSAGKNFAYVTNYLDNSVSAYSFNGSGTLASIDADEVTPGTQTSIPTRSNPISIAIDHAGAYAYVANAVSNDVSVYSINSSTGALTAISAGAPGTPTFVSVGTTPSSVKVGPNDQHLYVANRGSNSITIFPITTGALGTAVTVPVTDTVTTTTTNPVAIAIDPTGSYVYVVNYTSNSVNVYLASGGGLVKQSQVPTGTHPISISIDSTGQYAYVANSGSNDISAYSITTGALSHIDCTGVTCTPGANFPAGTSPSAVTTSQ